MMSWKRTLRTASSERFLLQRDGQDAAAVDLHYLANGTVSGTVILLKSAGWTEAEIPKLLKSLDDDFLPDVDLERVPRSRDRSEHRQSEASASKTPMSSPRITV